MTQNKMEVVSDDLDILKIWINSIQGNESLKQVLFEDLKSFQKYKNSADYLIYSGSQIALIKDLKFTNDIEKFLINRNKMYKKFHMEMPDIDTVIFSIKATLVEKQVKTEVSEILVINNPLINQTIPEVQKLTSSIPVALMNSEIITELKSNNISYSNEAVIL